MANDRYRDDEDRGLLGRAGDELRSWFGDEDAQRRQAHERGEDRGRGRTGGHGVQSWGQAQDEPGRGHYGAEDGGRYAGGQHGQSGRRHHDPHYLDWRERQLAELDRDYDEYQRERQQRFHEDFSTWRSDRQTERGRGASTRAAESVRPSDMAGGNAGAPASPAAAGTDYAGEPGPAGIRGENHMDPVKIDEKTDPSKA